MSEKFEPTEELIDAAKLAFASEIDDFWVEVERFFEEKDPQITPRAIRDN